MHYKCEYCNVNCATLPEWQIHTTSEAHRKLHPENSRYFCTNCPAIFVSPIQVDAHLGECQALNSSSVFTCAPCKTTVCGKQNWSAHLHGINHQRRLRGEDGGQWHCNLCHADISGRKAYEEHISGKTHKNRKMMLEIKGERPETEIVHIVPDTSDEPAPQNNPGTHVVPHGSENPDPPQHKPAIPLSPVQIFSATTPERAAVSACVRAVAEITEKVREIKVVDINIKNLPDGSASFSVHFSCDKPDQEFNPEFRTEPPRPPKHTEEEQEQEYDPMQGIRMIQEPDEDFARAGPEQ